MPRVLLIDDDTQVLATVGHLLSSVGWNVASAPSGALGLRMAEHLKPHVALIDLRLPDMPGLDVLRHLSAMVPRPRCAILTAFGSYESAVEAMRLGASDYVEKTVIDNAIIELVTKLVHAPTDSDAFPANGDGVEAHSMRRWADVILRTIRSQRDPKTLREWGRSVGASEGALRNWCRTAHIPARRSLLFARLLRAVVRQENVVSAPEDLLNIVDRRTLTKVLTLSGTSGDRLPKTPSEFLQKQQFVDNPRAIQEIQSALVERNSKEPGEPW